MAQRPMKGVLIVADAPDWTEILGRVRHDFYHLPGYVALAAEQEGGAARALVVEDGHRGLFLPLIVRPIEGGGSDATSPYGYPGPLIWGSSDPDWIREAFHAGVEHLRSEGIVSLFVRLHPLLDEVPPVGVGRMLTHGETVSIDLTQSLDEIWSQTRNNHRRDISKSERMGYVARIDEDWQHFSAFIRLYRETMERLSAEERYLFDERYFIRLREALGPSAMLWVVAKDDAIAAAVLFVETSGIVQYHLAGSDQEHAWTRPTKLLIRTVTRWAKERGDLRLHLGGGVGGADDSLMHFKAGFSDERHVFRTLRVVVDDPAYRRLVADRDPALDPTDLDGFFPLYRKP
jgi:GNAT acetyltransferase-like protein